MIDPSLSFQIANGVMVVVGSAGLAGVVGWVASVTILAAVAVRVGKEITG